ncbi:MAG: hypothetical protein GXP23_01480 [Gammaproteobacteria bacterium]|nr:hypothetical protein [Gammaproteobacteria bacterium]
MEKLTEFQVACEKKLSNSLATINKQLCGREVGEITDTYFDRANETYIHASVDETNIDLWIYDDGAMFSGPGLDMRYEREDYASEEELMNAFVTELLTALRNT